MFIFSECVLLLIGSMNQYCSFVVQYEVWPLGGAPWSLWGFHITHGCENLFFE